MAVIAPPNLHPLKDNCYCPLFTEEELKYINEWFDTKAQPTLVINDDEEPISVITVAQFQDFMDLKKFHRRNYHYPTYGEIMLEVEKLNMGVTRVLTREQFEYMLNKWVIQPEIRKELLLAFQVFDTEKRSYLDIEELVPAVTLHGDAFNESEKLELIRDANTRGDGVVYYENFIESMFSIFPELYDLKVQYLYLNPDEDPTVPPLPPEPEPEPEPEAPPPPSPPPTENKKEKGKGNGKGKGKKK